MRIDGIALAVVFTFGLVLAGANAQCTPSGDTVPRDCKEVYDRGCTQDGVYTIDPGCPDLKPFNVRCDMKNGKWIVFQRRYLAQLSFERNWTEYENGFGDPRYEIWLGLKKLHCITFSSCRVELRVDMTSNKGIQAYATYSSIAVHNADNKHRLALGTYSGGNAGDSLKGKDCNPTNGNHDGMYFSTPDRDNDRSSGNCAQGRRDGWWYNNCACADLNSPYIPYHAFWSTFSNYLKCTEMKVRSTD